MAQVILVNENDDEIGEAEKMEAHVKGLLHRAFSVFIFDKNGNYLLQRRSLGKYHSPGLWTNTCCSHPNPGETTEVAANRRLKEEMGIACKISKSFELVYRFELSDNITEYEFDHVYSGTWDGSPVPDQEEVAEWKWMSRKALEKSISQAPAEYTEWFKLILSQLEINN